MNSELIKENKRHLAQHQVWLKSAREDKGGLTDIHIESLMIHIGVIKERIARLKGKTTGMWLLDENIWGK